MKITNCPSTLASGYETYSPIAIKHLFDGKKVSPFLPYASEGSKMEIIESVGRISLSGVQAKFSMNIGDDLKLHYTKKDESGKIYSQARSNVTSFVRQRILSRERKSYHANRFSSF